MWCEGKLKADFNYILAWRGFLCHQHQGVWNLGVTSRDVLLRTRTLRERHTHPPHLWFSYWLWIVNFVLTFSTLYISSISWVAGVKLIQCAKQVNGRRKKMSTTCKSSLRTSSCVKTSIYLWVCFLFVCLFSICQITHQQMHFEGKAMLLQVTLMFLELCLFKCYGVSKNSLKKLGPF